MATQPRNWIREWVETAIADSTEPRHVMLHLIDGELDGMIIEARFCQRVVPPKIYAGDLQPSAVGSYLLAKEDGDTYYYRCRIDDDFVRLRSNKFRVAFAVARARRDQWQEYDPWQEKNP